MAYVDDYYLIDETDASSRRGGRLTDDKRFSSENPYYQQMRYATKRSELNQLREAAIEWEANNAQYERQLADSHPAVQAAKQRAAGINPDLGAGTAGSATGGSAGVPAFPDTEVDNIPTPLEQASTIIGMTSDVVGAVSGVASCFSSFANFSKTIAELPGVKAASKIAEGSVAAKNLASTADYIGGLYRYMPGFKAEYGESTADAIPLGTYEQLAPVLKSLKVDDPEQAYKDMQNFATNPELRRDYFTRLRESQVAQANAAAESTEQMYQLRVNQLGAERINAEMDNISANIASMVQKVVYQDENGNLDSEVVNLLAGTEIAALDAENVRQTLLYKRIKQDLVSWNKRHLLIQAQIKHLDEQIAKWPKDNQDKANYRNFLLLKKAQLQAVDARQIDSIISVFTDISRASGAANVLLDDGGAYFGEAEKDSSQLELLNYYFNSSSTSGGELMSLIDTALGALIMGLTRGKTKKTVNIYK